MPSNRLACALHLQHKGSLSRVNLHKILCWLSNHWYWFLYKIHIYRMLGPLAIWPLVHTFDLSQCRAEWYCWQRPPCEDLSKIHVIKLIASGKETIGPLAVERILVGSELGWEKSRCSSNVISQWAFGVVGVVGIVIGSWQCCSGQRCNRTHVQAIAS